MFELTLTRLSLKELRENIAAVYGNKRSPWKHITSKFEKLAVQNILKKEIKWKFVKVKSAKSKGLLKPLQLISYVVM